MRLYLRLLQYLRPQSGRLALALACMGLYAITNFVSLGMIVPLTSVLFGHPDSVTGAGVTPAATTLGGPAATASRHPTLPSWPGATSPWPEAVRRLAERSFRGADALTLGRVCLAILIVFLLKNLADYAQSFLMASVEQGVIRDLRNDLHERLQDLSVSFYQSRRTGALVSRVTNDMEYLRAALASAISNFIKDTLTLTGALVWVLATSWRLALLSLLVVPPVLALLVSVGRRMRRHSVAAQESMAVLTANLHEYVASVRVVKAFGAEEFEQRKLDRSNQDLFRGTLAVRRAWASTGPASEVTIVAVAVTLLWLSGREIFVVHHLAAPSFLLFVIALLTMVSPIRRLSEVHVGIQQGLAAAVRIFGILDTAPTVVDAPGAQPLPRLRDSIRYEHVSFAYDPGRPVLEDVCFEIHRGETVALVGSSGAGKTTILDLLARFYDPTLGRITIDGIAVGDGTLASLRAQLGIVTQDTFLFHDTVRANIIYGARDASDEAIRAAASAAHADSFIERLPQGYDTVVGERGSKLSGGERQRLAIARAVLRDPAVLLLDEATSSLDAESERIVQEALERLMRGRTVLVIAHRLATAQRADRILVVEEGRIVGSGTHRELMDRDGPYRLLHRRPLDPLGATPPTAAASARAE